MRLNIIILCSILGLMSCSSDLKTITITNNSEVDRMNEMVEINASNFDLKKNFIFNDSEGNEIEYQLINKEYLKTSTIIFQANVEANSQVQYFVKEGKLSAINAKTFGRQIPERKDDFAWENDYAAYRMYGPALANEYPSNGVDLWLKKTDELVVDKRYREELENGKTYHVDHGDGLDCYKVGHTLGAGGIAAFLNDTLWVGNHYDSFEVLSQGPLRTSFVLNYDSVKIGSNYYKQSIQISLDAGSIMNKATVKIEGVESKMELAAGIFLHDIVDSIYTNNNEGVIAYAENAVSNAGIPSGRNYVAVIMPTDKTNILQQDKHLLIKTDYSVNQEFSYYFGGGWSEWHFPTDKDWFEAVMNYQNQLKEPLDISVQ